MNNLQVLLGDIAKHWGWEVGNKVKQEIDAILGAQNIDIDALQAAVATIQGMLDADAGTPEFDVGQNIVTQLSNHLTRITGLEGAVAILNGSEETAGSVAYVVKQERDRAVAAEAALQTAITNEATARADADADLQAQIDTLNGGSSASIASITTELDAIEAGAGLNSDGTYTADTATNYIDEATSLKDADKKLDAKLKEVADSVAANSAANATSEAALQSAIDNETARATAAEAAAKAEAIAASQAYVDTNFVTKQAIADISAVTLASIFRQALDCGFSGATKQDVLDGTGSCASAGGGDGAVI